MEYLEFTELPPLLRKWALEADKNYDFAEKYSVSVQYDSLNNVRAQMGTNSLGNPMYAKGTEDKGEDQGYYDSNNANNQYQDLPGNQLPDSGPLYDTAGDANNNDTSYDATGSSEYIADDQYAESQNGHGRMMGNSSYNPSEVSPDTDNPDNYDSLPGNNNDNSGSTYDNTGKTYDNVSDSAYDNATDIYNDGQDNSHDDPAYDNAGEAYDNVQENYGDATTYDNVA
eukprot:UC4_evm1s1534